MEQRETSTGTSAPDCSISRVEHALGPLRGRWKKPRRSALHPLNLRIRMTRGVGPHGTRARGPRQTTPQFSVGAPSELVDVVPAAFIVADGLGVWLIAPVHTTTAGASGLIFGLFGYRWSPGRGAARAGGAGESPDGGDPGHIDPGGLGAHTVGGQLAGPPAGPGGRGGDGVRLPAPGGLGGARVVGPRTGVPPHAEAAPEIRCRLGGGECRAVRQQAYLFAPAR